MDKLIDRTKLFFPERYDELIDFGDAPQDASVAVRGLEPLSPLLVRCLPSQMVAKHYYDYIITFLLVLAGPLPIIRQMGQIHGFSCYCKFLP